MNAQAQSSDGSYTCTRAQPPRAGFLGEAARHRGRPQQYYPRDTPILLIDGRIRNKKKDVHLLLGT